MEHLIIFVVLIINLLLALISFTLIFFKFKNYYSGIGTIIISSYFFLLLYVIFELGIFYVGSHQIKLLLSRFSVSILAAGFFLLHYFHDDISTEYRQRKTMTLGSFIFGIILGIAWIDSSIKISDKYHATILEPIYGLIIVFQSALVLYRITSHNIVMGELSDHYGIDGKISMEFRKLIQKILPVFSIMATLGFLFIDDLISTPMSLLITLGSFLLAVLYYRDPLSTLPIGQPMQAIALIRDENIQFLHVFASSGETVANHEDFGSLMSTLALFFKEIMKSNSPIRSISTSDVLVMFEVCGMDFLVLVLKHRAPLVRRILRSTAGDIFRNNIQSKQDFIDVVTQQLLLK